MMIDLVIPVEAIKFKDFREGNIDKNGFYGVNDTILYLGEFEDYIEYKDYAINADYIAEQVWKNYIKTHPQNKTPFWWEDEKFEAYVKKHPDEVIEELENAIDEYIWEKGSDFA